MAEWVGRNQLQSASGKSSNYLSFEGGGQGNKEVHQYLCGEHEMA